MYDVLNVGYIKFCIEYWIFDFWIESVSINFMYINFLPEPKSIILFPSFLNHKVMPNETNKDRYSIAFNIIPKGEFGDTTMKLYL